MVAEHPSRTAARIMRSAYPDVPIPNVSLTELVFAHAAEYGDRPALIDGQSGRTITYAQLVDGIKRCAAGLSSKGFRKGDVLAIYAPNVPEYAIAFHAAATLGGITTTVNPLYTADELAQQMRDSGAKFLLTIGPLMDKAGPAADKVATVQEVFVFGEAEGATPFASLLTADAEPPHVDIDPSRDLVTLPYSSGTTGLPKGVMLSHRNLVAQLTIAQARPDLIFPEKTDTLLAFLPFFHIYGIIMFLNAGLWRGSTVVTMMRFDLEQYASLIERFKVTYLHLVPPVALALAKHPLVDKYDLSSAKWALSSAAPLGGPVAEAFTARLGTQLFQAYGMTEVSGATHIGSCEPESIKPTSGGSLMPNTECLVVDPVSGEALERGQ